ncbi:hypothetical protein [Shinella sp.]|uniref:hypothetical protein n=1 Tax=Shinella sp. TaxID=1870904 RepID=UPI0029BCDFFA|nr:hypothetical protein [Shinella sp.]MDX3973243.1 hypothetical protein [Shinella sp.]
MTDLSSLIESLEKATAPDRWLDAKIDAALRIGSEKMRQPGCEWAWTNFPTWAHHTHARGMCGVQHDNGDLGLVWDSQPFSSSIDAAVALAERVLPGWTIASIGQDDRKGWHAELRKGHATSYSTVELAGAPTPAIALLLATLRALQSYTGEA